MCTYPPHTHGDVCAHLKASVRTDTWAPVKHCGLHVIWRFLLSPERSNSQCFSYMDSCVALDSNLENWEAIPLQKANPTAGVELFYYGLFQAKFTYSVLVLKPGRFGQQTGVSICHHLGVSVRGPRSLVCKWQQCHQALAQWDSGVSENPYL